MLIKVTEVNISEFAYRLFHEDFSIEHIDYMWFQNKYESPLSTLPLVIP